MKLAGREMLPNDKQYRLLVSGVSHSFERPLFANVDFELAAGQCLLLTGENGVGKSTLLRIVSGLLRPCSGSVELHGFPVVSSGSFKRMRRMLNANIMYLHQQPYLFSGSVMRNLRLALSPCTPDSIAQNQLSEALLWSGLSDVADQSAAQLSGGECQRLALARAKIRGARFLLLDEPTSNLDQDARQRTLLLLDELRRDGVAIVLACHEYQELAGIADGLLILAQGQLHYQECLTDCNGLETLL